MSIEGIDYSSTGGSDWTALANAIKAAGKAFAVRYVVNDKSPDGRGITRAEADALTAAGLDIGAVWEGTADRMRLGGAAGQADAANAQANLVAAGLPPTMPIYFACDYDATPGDQAAIDAYLRGAATVLGANRVGIYGGFWIVSRCAANKSAAWYWQTTAWSGGNVFPGNHLYQYDYNQFIHGVNVDATRALQDNYGQASKFKGGSPKPQPKPSVAYPAGLDLAICQKRFGSFKASTGVTIAFSEGEELSALWLSHGAATACYPKIVGFERYQDSPNAARSYWLFEGGYAAWRENDQAAIKELKAA